MENENINEELTFELIRLEEMVEKLQLENIRLNSELLTLQMKLITIPLSR